VVLSCLPSSDSIPVCVCHDTIAAPLEHRYFAVDAIERLCQNLQLTWSSMKCKADHVPANLKNLMKVRAVRHNYAEFVKNDGLSVFHFKDAFQWVTCKNNCVLEQRRATIEMQRFDADGIEIIINSWTLTTGSTTLSPFPWHLEKVMEITNYLPK